MIPLPSTPLLIAAGVAVALLVGAGGGWRARGTIAERDIAELVAKQATSPALPASGPLTK